MTCQELIEKLEDALDRKKQTGISKTVVTEQLMLGYFAQQSNRPDVIHRLIHRVQQL